MIEVEIKLTMAPLAAAIQSIPFNHKPSFLLIIPTHPVNFFSERKPEKLRKNPRLPEELINPSNFQMQSNFRCLQLHVRSAIRILDLRNYFSSSGHLLQPQLERYYNLGCVEWRGATI